MDIATNRYAISVKPDHATGEWAWGIAGGSEERAGNVPARGREDAVILAIAASCLEAGVLVVSLHESSPFWGLVDDVQAWHPGVMIVAFTEQDADLRARAVLAIEAFQNSPAESLLSEPLLALTVATDGSARSRKIGWAWVSTDGQHDCGWSSPDRADYNAVFLPMLAELRAIAAAVDALPGRELVIKTDSKPAIRLVLTWLRGVDVLPEGYRGTLGKASRKGGLVWIRETLRRESGRFRLEWVRGHAGDPLNEGADSLAKLARRYAEGTWGLTADEVPLRAKVIADTFSRCAVELAA